MTTPNKSIILLYFSLLNDKIDVVCHLTEHEVPQHMSLSWISTFGLAVWLSGNASLASINVVALRQTRLVLG